MAAALAVLPALAVAAADAAGLTFRLKGLIVSALSSAMGDAADMPG